MREDKRKHLMQSEVEKMMVAAENGPDPERNSCLLWMCFVHGFRVSELCQLSLSDMDTASDNLYIKRLKNGLSTTHPLSGTEKNCLPAGCTAVPVILPQLKTTGCFCPIKADACPVPVFTGYLKCWVSRRSYLSRCIRIC